MEEDIAQKEFLIDNTQKPELLLIQNEVRKSFDTQKSNEMQHAKDFNPASDLLFGTSSASYVKPTLETRNYNIEEAYAPLSTGEYTAKFDSYKEGRDNNEYFAQAQTTGEKWANGATKFLAKTGSAVLGGTAGLVYGVGAALNDGSFSSIYDNSFSNTLADWDTKLGYQLPNLYTKQEQEKGLLGQMGTANFWSDKFLGGISFTAGAIISEGIWAYATGGLSLSTAGARLGVKSIGKWGVGALGETAALQGLSKYKGLYKTMLEGTVAAGKISKTTANRLGRAGEFVSSVGVLARSAGYEASVEALQYKREAAENFHQNFLNMNGREPSQEEVAAFQSHNESAANTVFGVNMAILMPSNLVTMGHILDIKSPIKTGFSNFIDKKAFGYGIGKTVDTAGKVAYKALEATTGQKVARTAFNYVLKPALTEGLFEEGMQGVTTKTANKWVEHTYDPKYSNANLDTMGAFYESLGEQYGTKEGWVENGLGMIIGIVGGAVNARSESKQKAAELSYQADVATTFQTDNLQAMVMPNRLQSANRMAGFSEEAKREAQKGNISKSSLAQKSSLLTFINAKMVMGEGIPDIVREIKLGLDSTTEEQWKDAGIEADQIDTYKEESLKEFEDLAKDWKANKTYWGYMIGKKIVGQESLDTEIVGDISLSSKTGAIIEALAWQSTIGEAANKHMKQAQDVIAQELGSEYSKTVNLNSSLLSQKRELRQQVNVATRSYKTEIARRDALVARIAKLNAAPKQPEAANKPAGKQAAAMTQALLESEQKIAELNIEIEGYAEQINKTSNYQKELETLDFSNQDLSVSAISGQDLISLKDNITKFETILEGLQTTNPQRATYLKDILKEYSDSEEVFLQNQATQRVISHPDFKIENINSWIQGKAKSKTPMNENTLEWMTATLETYKKGKIASMSVQAKARVEEDKEARKQAIIEELNSIEDPEDPRVKELQAELASIEKPEEVIIPKDKGEVVPKTREQKIQDEIDSLEVKKQEELAKIKIEEEEVIPLTFTEMIDTAELRRPNGSIGTQGFTEENLKTLIEFIAKKQGITLPTFDNTLGTSELRQLIDFLKSNEENKNKVLEYVKSDPVEINKLPDDTYHVQDGNHRANLLNLIGVEQIPTITSEQKEQISKVETTQEKLQKEVDRIVSKYDSRIEPLKNELAGKGLSQIEVYKKRISEALKGRHNYLTYMGDNYDDVANKKPTSEEVEEFKSLREAKKFNDPRYQELQQKLSDWKLLDSAVDEEYTSLGDLIVGVEQLEQEVEEQETLDEVVPEHVPDIIDDEGLKASDNIVRYDILQNTNGAVTVKRKKDGNFTLHHLKSATIAQKIGGDFTLVNKSGEGILFGEEQPGSVLTVEGVEFRVVEGNAIEVKEEEFMPLQQKLNMYPLNTGAVRWSYSDIYTKVGDDFVKMESDFKDSTINSERIYELQEGDKLAITINNDGYNDKLLSDYESAKGKAKEEALKKLKDNLKLNATTVGGVVENVSILKALRGEIDENFIRLREKAFDSYMAATDKSNVKLGIVVQVDGIFLGSPRFIISEEGNTKSAPITERGAKEVIATGYIYNGDIVVNREVKDINKTFVGQLSKKNTGKKIPIVVFRRGNYNVAYPVSMNKTDNDLSTLFDSILSMNIPQQEKIRKVNQEIQNNNIETPKLVYEDIYNDKKLEDTRKAFSEMKSFVTADEFADSNYIIGNIVSDASINIDLEDIGGVIQDAKLRIKLDDSVKYTTDRDLKYESMTELENEISDIARELYKDYFDNAQTRYIKANGDIIEETGYTDTLDDNPIEVPTNQLEKIKNINILRKAFKGLTAPLIKIIGKDKISAVNDMFDQYDFIKSQLAISSNTLNNGSNNSQC